MRYILVALWLLLTPLAAFAQDQTSRVTGTIASATQTIPFITYKTGGGSISANGTWAGTLRLQCRVGVADTLVTVTLAPVGGGVSVVSFTANGMWMFFGGYSSCVVNASAWASGTATISALSTNAKLALPPTASAGLSNPVTPAQGGTGADFSASTGVLYDAAGTFSAIACASGLLQGGSPPSCTTTPALGTPASGVATNLTGTAAGLTAGLATALAADPADCAAGTVALGIVASGAATCTATPTLTSLQGIIGNVTPAAGTFTTGALSPAANTVPLTISGYSVTGSGTSSMILGSGTLNTSGVVHADDRAYTVTAAGAGSTLFRIRGGAAGTTNVFSIGTDSSVTVSQTGASYQLQNEGKLTFNARNAAGGHLLAFSMGNSVAPTSGGTAHISADVVFSPTSGSGSFASLHLNPTINGTSSGIAYGLLLASKTNTLTGGTIKLASFGSTTTDGFTGYTREFEVLGLGAWFAKTMTASAAAPGADGAKFEIVCGTNAGSAKLVMYAGTSGTAVTVVDNVGAGVTGC